MEITSFNSEEISKVVEEMKISFSKEISELNQMIKEELGENKHYYRISLISELIEKDIKELLNIFNDTLLKSLEKSEYIQKETKELKDLVKNLDIIEFDEDLDPVSQIVKDLNTLDDFDKWRIMTYVSGFTSASENRRIDKYKAKVNRHKQKS